MNTQLLNLLLADDDTDDYIFFKEALEELPFRYALTRVSNGAELMSLLNTPHGILPDMLFLDMNMPFKNGLECLSEIKDNKKLQPLPVIIFSTSFDHQVANLLYEKGAHYYLRKPSDFAVLKRLIHKAIFLVSGGNKKQADADNFFLNPE